MSLPAPSLLARIRPLRLQPGARASAAVLSLPVPPGVGDVAVSGAGGQSVPIAWWPERLLDGEEPSPATAPRVMPSAYPSGRHPRRLLVTACSPGELPDELGLAAVDHVTPVGEWAGPTWELAVLDKHYAGRLHWEVDELVLRYEGKRLGLRLGLRTQTEGLMWWEWVRCETLWSGPACTAIRASGSASAIRLTDEHPDCRGSGASPWVHHQHWVQCEVYALLFANGVIHLTLRHVNNHLYDDNGQELQGVVPVLGFRGVGSHSVDMPLSGETVELHLGDGIAVSTEECRSLASAEAPGRAWTEDGVTVVQAYEGVDIPLGGYGRTWRQEDTGSVCRAQERRIPAGVARTVRCCLSLGQAPPRVERYVLPYWWYGLCAELGPSPMLPVSDLHDPVIDAAGQWLATSQLRGSFAAGSVPRAAAHYTAEGQFTESGWEGETPYNLIRYFYRRPSPDVWEAALRDAYFIADVATDHVHFMMHMHGYPFGAISLTMNRSLGLIQGYLETGDPYLRETAENMALCSWALDNANWPRRSYGRDAMYIRGLIALEDYLPDRGHGQRAREAIGRAIACQREDGSYSDQGGPGGHHASGNLVIKPWMNFMVAEPMLDWLERHPEDAEVAWCVRRICDWQLTTIVEDEEGAHFPYEWAWGDNVGAPGAEPGSPGSRHPHGRLPGVHYPARALLFATRYFGDPCYLEAWERCYETLGGYEPNPQERVGHKGDHAANKAVEWLTWFQMYRWWAQWEGGELRVSPCPSEHEDISATILTPEGPRSVGGGAHCP